MAAAAPFIRIDGLTKRYPGVTALDDVSLDIARGEVHALIGENGAGKSTLIKVLSGATRADEGRIEVNGEDVDFASPAAARARGIVGIFQELAIESWMDVTSNIVLGNEPTHGPAGQILAFGRADTRAREALDRLGARNVTLKGRAGRLGTAQKQLVEIARSIAIDAPLIIMDEPTASLPGSDAENLLRIILELRERGATVVFVSHRLDEVRAVADRVTVLRNGRHVCTEPASEMSVERMIERMVGRPMDEVYLPPETDPGEVRFRARGLTRAGAFDDVSFEVRRGEVLGFSGLIGAGRSEVMRAIAGADRLDAGAIEIDGKAVRIRRPTDAIRAGIAYLPEDRKEQGLVLSMSCRENMALPSLGRFSRGGLVRRRRVRERTDDIARRLQVRGNVDSAAKTLSGGNQQKLVIAKWMLTEPQVLIFDEPTRGIDVGAKPEVYRLMHELAARGAAVIVVSSELPEVMNVSHRMIVMSRGRVTDRLDRADFDEERILTAAFAGHARTRADAKVA
jgi:ABC-type sugar transport system ATPase subunit